MFFIVLSLYLKYIPINKYSLKGINVHARTHFLEIFYTFFSVSIFRLEHVNAGELFYSRVISRFFTYHFRLILIWVILVFRCFAETVNDNETDYYKKINGWIDTVNVLPQKTFFIRNLMFNMSKTYWGVYKRRMLFSTKTKVTCSMAVLYYTVILYVENNLQTP